MKIPDGRSRRRPDAMLEQLSERLAAALDRLRAAVLAGVDTEPHRQAVSAIEADIARERTRQQEAAAEQAQQRASAVADRAAELAAVSHHRVASCIPPLPTRPESTNDEH